MDTEKMKKKRHVCTIYMYARIRTYICIRIYTLLLISMMFLLESSLFEVLDYIVTENVNHPC